MKQKIVRRLSILSSLLLFLEVFGTTVPDLRTSKVLSPRTDLDWDSFGFSLNGVRTKYMYIATCRPDSCPEDQEPWLSAETNSCDEENVFNSHKYGGGGRIVPHSPISMDPASTALNYGQILFEGLKAMRRPDGSIVVFRPEMNARRLAAGARRICIPPVPEKLFIDAITQTVQANCEMIPPPGKGSLYLRPLLFGSGGALGVGPSPEYTFVVYCSPVGGYFKKATPETSTDDSDELKSPASVEKHLAESEDQLTSFSPPPPIRLLMTPRFHRSVEGGVGSIKASGNYAPCFKASKQIKNAGYDEVLFLDARSDEFVEEAGASNFFAIGGPDGQTLYTPGLGRGSILPGITRASIVELARSADFNLNVVEGDLAVSEVLRAGEAFCCGTGATITPVGEIALERGGAGSSWVDAKGEPGSPGAGHRSVTFPHFSTTDNNRMVAGPVTMRLAERMAAILAGTAPDRFGWIHRVL